MSQRKNNNLRELTSRTIIIVGYCEGKRQYLVDYKIVIDLLKLFEDEKNKIRSNAYYTFLILAKYIQGIDFVTEYEINFIYTGSYWKPKNQFLFLQ